MTETTTRIQLTELSALRLSCKNPKCGVVLTCGLDELGRVESAMNSSHKCSFCGEHTTTEVEWEALASLSKTLSQLSNSDLQIEIVLGSE